MKYLDTKESERKYKKDYHYKGKTLKNNFRIVSVIYYQKDRICNNNNSESN